MFWEEITTTASSLTQDILAINFPALTNFKRVNAGILT